MHSESRSPAAMLVADEFCTCNPHHKDAEVFGLGKCKLNVPLGSDHDSHHPNKVNFSQPRGLGRFTRERMALVAKEEEVENREEVHHCPSVVPKP